MSGPTPDAPDQRAVTLPEGRYGEAAGSGLTGKLVAVFLVLLVGALLVASSVTIYRLNATPSVDSEVIGVNVVGDDRVEVALTVTRDEPSTPVYCIIRAQDQSKGELGRREVYVAPSPDSTVRIDTYITTSERAFMADGYGCGEDVPDYLRR